ncbi:hypothetical protein HIM_12170 [Hirsutella minnesotensis 3608]|uniref:Uncharacterized protein n=1 Tax=Hirsutella minnesotensis 3608 TaxID=1043627 RepID=A0A0F7ZIC2_9HYPO|nr:hypothetical protein HIM_12170 [Hirsutella minnesotensis 3608]
MIIDAAPTQQASLWAEQTPMNTPLRGDMRDSRYEIRSGLSDAQSSKSPKRTIDGCKGRPLLAPLAPLAQFDKTVDDATLSRFEDIHRQIENPLLEYILEYIRRKRSREKYRPIAVRLMVLGHSESAAKPCIVVLCPDPQAKLVRKFFDKESIRTLCRPPDNEFPLFEVHVIGRPLEMKWAGDDIDVFIPLVQESQGHANGTYCGAPLTACLPSGARKRCTFGGILTTVSASGDTKLFGLTASHVLLDDDSDDWRSDGSATEIDASSDTVESQISCNILPYTLGEDYTGLSQVAEMPQLNTTNDDGPWPSFGLSKIGSITQDTLPLGRSTAGNGESKGYYDWALIDMLSYRPNRIQPRQPSSSPAWDDGSLYPRDLVMGVLSSSTHQRHSVHLLTASEGPKRGFLSTLPSKVLLAPGRAFVNTFVVTLEDNKQIADGDSGSWVVNEETLEVYGYVVASDFFGGGYIISMAEAFEDIKANLGLISVLLASSFDVATAERSRYGLTDNSSSALRQNINSGNAADNEPDGQHESSPNLPTGQTDTHEISSPPLRRRISDIGEDCGAKAWCDSSNPSTDSTFNSSHCEETDLGDRGEDPSMNDSSTKGADSSLLDILPGSDQSTFLSNDSPNITRLPHDVAGARPAALGSSTGEPSLPISPEHRRLNLASSVNQFMAQARVREQVAKWRRNQLDDTSIPKVLSAQQARAIEELHNEGNPFDHHEENENVAGQTYYKELGLGAMSQEDDDIDDELYEEVNNLGSLYADQGRLPEAETMYKRALEGFEKARGRDHTSTLDTVNNLGNLYADQGKLPEAEAMYKRALEGSKKALGRDHTSTLITVNNLGYLYADQGKLPEAEAMYKRALEGSKKALGRDHTSTLITVNNLGYLYADQGKLPEAEAMFERALEGFEKALGRDHTSTLDTVNNLGLLYKNQDKLPEAEAMFERALEGFEKARGRDHTSTLDTVNNLGNLYADQGKLPETDAMYIRALEGKEKALGLLNLQYGRDHPSTLITVNNLGSLYADQGKLPETEAMYDTVNNLGSL